MAKRSSGVVLIVTLLAWSVNLPAIACPAMNSWAAVMMQAGTSPAPEPEPSPSRHSCCPAQKVTRTQTQPADRNCTFHAKPGPGCCSVTSNPVSTPLPQIVTKPNLLKFFCASASASIPDMIVAPAPRSTPSASPPDIPQSSSSVLRL